MWIYWGSTLFRPLQHIQSAYGAHKSVFVLWSQGDLKYVHNKKASESTLVFSYNVNAHRTVLLNSFQIWWTESALILFF